jgi:hypothetical protein
MSDERDPQLLELFAHRRPTLDDKTFTARVVEHIEREQQASSRIRITALAFVLIATAFAMPLLVRCLAIVSDALTAKLTIASFEVDPGSSWLATLSLSLAGFAVVALWRTLRNAR